MRWPRIVAIALVAALVLMGGAAWWLLRSESGLNFVLARAVAALDGKLSVQRAQGSLTGPLSLQGVRYRDAAEGVDARVERVTLDIAPLALLAKRLHVRSLGVDDVNVTLTSQPPTPKPGSNEFSLAPPLDIAIDKFALQRARVEQDGKPVFTVDRADVAGGWTHAGIAITQLALRAPDGSVDLDGTLSVLGGYSGHGQSTFHWTLDGTRYAGTLKANSNGQHAQFNLVLGEPTPATLTANLGQTDAWPWTLKLDLPAFDPRRIRHDITLQQLGAALEGSGDRSHGAINGTVSVDAHKIQIEPLRYTLDGRTLNIETLTLKTPDAPGVLNANGAVHLDADPLSATLALDWDGVELPADLVGQTLATHGKLDIAGSAQNFTAQGTLAIGPPDQLADIRVDLAGTPQAIALTTLELVQDRGSLVTQGRIELQPQIGWELTAKASRFDPGSFAAQWPGALDFDLATHGVMTDQGPDAQVTLDHLGGTLRQRALSGKAHLTIKPDYIVDGTLALASGKSRIDIDGRGGQQTDATIKLAIASLADWLPDAGGSANGEFHVRGRWPDLAVSGQADGKQLAFGDDRIGALDLSADIRQLQPPQGSLSLKADAVSAGGLDFDTLTLDARGNQAAHSVNLHASGSPLSTRLALEGSAGSNGTWKGTLSTLDLAIKDAKPLALEAPAQLAWNGKTFNAGEICLTGQGPKLCVAGDAGSDGAIDARYRIEQLPLALLAKLGASDVPINVTGELAGNGQLRRAANGALDGQATLHSERGSIAYTNAEGPALLGFTNLAVDAQLSPSSTQASVRAALDGDGHLDGQVTLRGAAGGTQDLSGRVDLLMTRLDFVELLTPEVANTKGRIEAHYTLGGTTLSPQIEGALELKQFATEIPGAGLKLQDGDISLRASDAEHFVLEGRIKSGEGTVTIAGSGGLAANAPFKATIKGDNVLAADIPAARVIVSPDLTLERTDKNFSVGGSITIPESRVDLAKLPGGGVSKNSPDLVITDAERPAPGAALPVLVNVNVKLGNRVRMSGMGLDGRLGGQLAVSQLPGRVATGTGSITVNGTYKAYGQDLTIKTGRLLFAGTPLDNPGLDIRAAREIKSYNVTAGLEVTGTALLPVLTVYSDPVMEQSEALSYLVAGKPLSQLKSGEGDILGTAARALGTAGGDLLAKGLGSRIGVEASVSDNAALGGAAFTVGKYLSPKLYLSYGVGVFDPGEVVTLRYIFNRRFNFEAENATTGNRASINYRYEK